MSFRETDETIQEPMFLNLSYVQAQHDFLLGNYPVVREDAAQMCALQILAEYGPEYWMDDYKFMKAIERYMNKRVRRVNQEHDLVPIAPQNKFLPVGLNFYATCINLIVTRPILKGCIYCTSEIEIVSAFCSYQNCCDCWIQHS